MKRKFILHSIFFFLPVILACIATEWLARNIPESYVSNEKRLEAHSEEIEILILGSSQQMNAINAALIDAPSLNLASGDQHHDTDFKLAKALLPRLPKLKTVVIELSYNHLEMPHNGPDFWKNTVYLSYYGINNFERNTYFKDHSLFLAQHSLFSKKIMEYYVHRERNVGFNAFGFDTLNFDGTFKKWNYSEEEIAKHNFKINLTPNLNTWQNNSQLLLEMIDYFRSKNIQVIISQVPMYKDFLAKRVPDILKRKNQVVSEIQSKYPEVMHLNREEDTVLFKTKDYINPSHLNPTGATKYSLLLNEMIHKNR